MEPQVLRVWGHTYALNFIATTECIWSLLTYLLPPSKDRLPTEERGKQWALVETLYLQVNFWTNGPGVPCSTFSLLPVYHLKRRCKCWSVSMFQLIIGWTSPLELRSKPLALSELSTRLMHCQTTSRPVRWHLHAVLIPLIYSSVLAKEGRTEFPRQLVMGSSSNSPPRVHNLIWLSNYRTVVETQ